jgi:hypothetical protein
VALFKYARKIAIALIVGFISAMMARPRSGSSQNIRERIGMTAALTVWQPQRPTYGMKPCRRPIENNGV